MLKLSFIVPVYNVAPYLRKCVDSLVHQDFNDYEIILIDDGSTDESGKICDELRESIRDERLVVRVLHQENGGLSAARNAGIKAAKGEYICFVDSDDYWEPNVLGGLMAQVKRDDLDVLRFDYQNVRIVESQESRAKSQEPVYEMFEPNKTPRYIDRKNEIVDGETYLNTRMGYACYAVMFVIRRALLMVSEMYNVENDCLFREGIHFEDVDWLPRMMLKAKQVNSTQTIVYDYFIRQGSITKTQGDKEKIRKNVEDSIAIIINYKTYQKQHPNCRWLYHMQSNIVVGTITSIARELYECREKYISQLRRLDVFPVIIADQGKTYRRRAVLINILGMRLYSRIIRYL